MNVSAMQALGLANRAAQAAPALFDDLAARFPGPDTFALESTGHAVLGRGGGRYIADHLCDDALLAGHPRLVFRSASGRIFRLLPETGSLAVEQAGAIGDGTTNDQPAIQAAIDYAAAVDAREVRFESATYRIDCPPRVSPADATRAEDGHPLVVRRSVRLAGHAACRSLLDFRGLGGIDPDANWQAVATSANDAAPAVWRGGGLYVQGDAGAAPPAELAVARLELDRLILRGNRRRTGNYSWPASPATGDGWDITDKALWVQDCRVGTIICRDTDLVGWRGEVVYLGGPVDAVERLELTRCRLLTSNASVLNPGVNAEILASDCEFGDGYQAQEDTGKSRAHFRNCTWRDSVTTWLGAGPAAAPLFNLLYPTRDEAAAPPRTVLENCHFEDVGTVHIASWVSGNIRTVDTQIVLTGDLSMALQDIDLTIDALVDRRSSSHVLTVYGVQSLTEQVPGAPEGTFKLPPSDIRLHVRHHRTALARENGLTTLGVYWTGYIDRSCHLVVEGDFGQGRTPNGGANPVSMPLVSFSAGSATVAYTAHGYFLSPPLASSGELAIAGPAMAIQVEGEQTVDLTLPPWPAGGAQFGFVDGQRLRLVKQGGNGAIRFLRGASPRVGVAADRVLDQAYDWIEFTFNRDWSRWEETGYFGAG